jgi:hypothetical protein
MSGERAIGPGQSMDWREHHYLLPRSPGDFTPVSAAEHYGDARAVPHLQHAREQDSTRSGQAEREVW